ncbi:MAG TPA: ATP-binding protein [Solirubrobacteraceae bacterium]|nr:ATP-binding protein [Solirubrobacteraceae bacterium]
MRATVLLPDTRAWVRRGGLTVSDAGSLVMRFRLELLWAAFAIANCAAMSIWPKWETVPFYFTWISLIVLYGFRVWPLGPTLVVLIATVALTGLPHIDQVLDGQQAPEKLVRVPLMAMLFLTVVWHARRRVDALRIAEGRAEQSRSMLERQERFVHDASHELRTPVTIARGHVELARAAGGESAAELDVALDELARMDALIERLLLLATADQTDFVLTREIDLEPFLEDVFMRWSEVAPRAWRLGPLVSGSLRADPGRLRTALDALLENAVKFTHERDAIGLQARADGQARVLIEIDDEGSGVPQEALERIFDRFARADAARTRSDGGVGLGLAIVDAIAKKHGGRCTVRNTGHGSTFALLLPGFIPARPGAVAAPAASGAVLAPADGAQPAAALSSSST